jgi:hypothetical protein
MTYTVTGYNLETAANTKTVALTPLDTNDLSLGATITTREGSNITQTSTLTIRGDARGETSLIVSDLTQPEGKPKVMNRRFTARFKTNVSHYDSVLNTEIVSPYEIVLGINRSSLVNASPVVLRIMIEELVSYILGPFDGTTGVGQADAITSALLGITQER